MQLIKDSVGYIEAIGTDLGVVGPVQTMPPAATLQPSLNGNAVLVRWGWQRPSRFARH